LNIPTGALSDPTPIEVSKLFLEEIDPIFQHYGSVKKYFAGGFEGKPNGLAFKSPIKVTIPVLPPRNSGDVPMLFAVDVVNHTYTPVSTTLHFDPVSSTVSVQIAHFSSWAIAFGEDIYKTFDCKANPSDCHCPPRTFTVAENVQEGAVSNECNYATVIGSVTFEQCPGKPLQEWSIRERNIPQIHILPEAEGELQLEYDQTRPLDTTLIDSDGRQLSSQWINWSFDPTQIVTIDPANLVRISPFTGPTTWVTAGETPGPTGVYAQAGCGSTAYRGVVVRPPGTPQLDLEPSIADLCQGSLTMKAIPRDSNGNEIPGVNITWWPVTPANVAILTPIANSYNAILEGITDAGDTATIKAAADGHWGSMLFNARSGPAYIRIGGLASFWISPRM